MKKARFYLGLILLPCLLLGCNSLTATFDQTAYTQVTSLKVDALDVMDKATENYTTHEAEVKTLQLKIDKAIEYDTHRPNNQVTNKLWTILNNPQGNLLGGFLARWKKDGTCGATFIQEEKQLVGKAFDQIAELESKKIKPSDVTINQ
ncbi:hypothetical protein SNE25_22070 [Mucilaginibacter sabulilitoris]|uniref:Lipoprotein n=1 Tax=Mucilaginibacter sabulilitoris TaxID=1173583 RepID=A0ABZ0TFQ3_9SPHI|nr:hypothetical protein [Mucilaginibacter sabulilitoris]WPU92009.1 hypothetical protein SNE25_22070 [Mucilaginibacter sabulilitoris]